MSDTEKHLEALSDIRNIMERSSRFLSLSGLSGVFAGLFALIGAGAIVWRFDVKLMGPTRYYDVAYSDEGYLQNDFLVYCFAVAIAILVASIGIGFLLTRNKAKKEGIKVWDATAKRLLFNLAIPLVTGGVFSLVLAYHEQFAFIAPAMLIFYGLALVNASKYTFHDIRILGLLEIALGLISSFSLGYGLLFWALGFGVLHIIYGISMHLKYER